MKPRFKIDVAASFTNKFVVSRRKDRVLLAAEWETLDYFPNIEAARQYIDEIKNLPEYIE